MGISQGTSGADLPPALLSRHDRHLWKGGLSRHYAVDRVHLAARLDRSAVAAPSLCAMCGVIPHDRHTAGGDAFITAQVFLRLERLAARLGRGRLERITETFEVPSTPT